MLSDTLVTDSLDTKTRAIRAIAQNVALNSLITLQKNGFTASEYDTNMKYRLSKKNNSAHTYMSSNYIGFGNRDVLASKEA